MDKVLYHQIKDDGYLGIVTFIAPESFVQNYLEKMDFNLNDSEERKIVVDLAIEVGLTKYRFFSLLLNELGKIKWNSFEYVIPKQTIEEFANLILLRNTDFAKEVYYG